MWSATLRAVKRRLADACAGEPNILWRSGRDKQFEESSDMPVHRPRRRAQIKLYLRFSLARLTSSPVPCALAEGGAGGRRDDRAGVSSSSVVARTGSSVSPNNFIEDALDISGNHAKLVDHKGLSSSWDAKTCQERPRRSGNWRSRMTPNRWMVNALAAFAGIAVYSGAAVTWGVAVSVMIMTRRRRFPYVSCSECVCPSASPDPDDRLFPPRLFTPDASSRGDPPRRAVLAALRSADRVPTPTGSADDGVTLPSASR